MRIAFVIGAVDNSGGAERVICGLANAYAKRDNEVTLIVFSQSEPFYKLDDRISYCQPNYNGKLPVVKQCVKSLQIRKAIKEARPEVIISFITQVNLISLILTAGLGIPVIVSERIDPAIYKGQWLDILRKILYQRAAAVVCQTNEASAYFKNSKFADRCYVIPNPITGGILTKTEYTKVHRACAVGRLTKQKNYPLMLEAFREFVGKDHAEYTLDIFGVGGLHGEIQHQINELDLSGQVFLKGRVNNIGERLKEYDFFLMTSDYEGMPNALAEAMAAGLPCIATQSSGGGVQDLITNNVNGVSIPVGDRAQLVASMMWIAGNQTLRETLGGNAKHITDRLSDESILEMWNSLIEKCRKVK